MSSAVGVRSMPELPVDDITTFAALGGTFSSHRAVSSMHSEVTPKWPPNLWTVPASAVVPGGEPIEIQPYAEKVTIGPEPAAVIGESLFRASEAEAAAGIKGFTVSNDLAALGEFPGYPYPDQETHSGRGFKIMPGFSPVATHYEPLDADDLAGRAIEAEIDGERVVEGSTDAMDWSPAEIVAHVSKVIRLENGDVISLGEPSTEHHYLDDADRVTCRVEGVAELTNPVRRVE
jgi:2-keto-4-pentenoate hydratase/2-oxohepta-3-ene-1,7-dioic acid hydratase in catechol pathway